MNYTWYERMTRKKLHPSSEQNSRERNESKADSIIKELKDKLSRLEFRLLDCQNQNQMLRKELLLAKKVVATEVSPDLVGNFSDSLHQSNSIDYHKGRREKILMLKDKIDELQNRIKEIEEDKSVKSSEDDIKVAKKCDKDQYYPERQIKSKELPYFLNNACQLKRKLEVWRKRNAELSKERELLRLELDRLLEKSEEDREVHQSFRTVEKDLRARQSEKIDMRNKLAAEESRNKQLVDEISSVKEDISVIMSKINDDRVLMDALNNQQGYLHDLLERQQLISENDHRRFQDNLREIEAKFTSNCGVLDHLKDTVEEKRLLCQQLQENIQQMVLIDNKEEEEQISTTTFTDESQQSELNEPQQQPVPTPEPPESTQEEPSEAENEKNKLLDERDEYVNIYLSIAKEIDQIRIILQENDERVNEWMSQLFESRSLLAKRNAEIRSFQEMLKILKETKPKSSKASCQEGSLFRISIKSVHPVFRQRPLQ